MDGVPHRPERRDWIIVGVLLAAGAALLAAYAVLKAAEIGKIGQPSDIGGGLIPLAGYVLLAVALVRGGRLALRSRR